MKGWACIVRAGGIGDNLVAASPARPLKRLGYNVEMITSELCGEVHRNNPFIDKLTIKKDGDIPTDGEQNLKWHLSRMNEYDIYAHLTHSMEVRHACFRNSVMFWHPQDYRRKQCKGSYLETAHEIAQAPMEFGPLFFPTEDEIDRATKTKEKIGPRYIVYVLSGTRIDKMYPYAGTVVSRIIKELTIPVVIMGEGEKQFEWAKEIEKHVRRQNSSIDGLHHIGGSPPPNTVSPDGRISEKGGTMDWPIRRSLTQAQLADCVICPDSGVWWSVCQEQMAKVLMLSHASEENIAKHCVNTIVLHADPDRVPCWPCHRLHDTQETCTPNEDGNASACMTDITVDTILEAVRKSLTKKKLHVVEEAA